MKVQVRRLGILQVGILLGTLYGFLALVALPFMVLSMVFGMGFSENRVEMLIPLLMPLLMILLYPVIGFIAGIIGATLYNLAARIVGGIKMELDVEPIPTADTTLHE